VIIGVAVAAYLFAFYAFLRGPREALQDILARFQSLRSGGSGSAGKLKRI